MAQVGAGEAPCRAGTPQDATLSASLLTGLECVFQALEECASDVKTCFSLTIAPTSLGFHVGDAGTGGDGSIDDSRADLHQAADSTGSVVEMEERTSLAQANLGGSLLASSSFLVCHHLYPTLGYVAFYKVNIWTLMYLKFMGLFGVAGFVVCQLICIRYDCEPWSGRDKVVRQTSAIYGSAALLPPLLHIAVHTSRPHILVMLDTFGLATSCILLTVALQEGMLPLIRQESQWRIANLTAISGPRLMPLPRDIWEIIYPSGTQVLPQRSACVRICETVCPAGDAACFAVASGSMRVCTGVTCVLAMWLPFVLPG
mmetsp:Transcript_44857/g.118762  ORF Transcript_44857/g.118762 Transcript_44857/m.118762 type:complete len:315 (-) Transcript_44857:7-951(-)